MNHFTTIETNADALNRALADFGIMHLEPIADGLNLIVVDREGKPRILEICVSENSVDSLLTIRLSDPLSNEA